MTTNEMTLDILNAAVRCDAMLEAAITQAMDNAVAACKRRGVAISDDNVIEAALDELIADATAKLVWSEYLRAMLADGAAAIEADLADGRVPA
jgi:hypothetical protein